MYENATWKEYQKVSDALLVISPRETKIVPIPWPHRTRNGRSTDPFVMEGLVIYSLRKQTFSVVASRLSLQPKSNFSVARGHNRKYVCVRRWGHSLDSYMWHTSCINASNVIMRAFNRKQGYLSHIFLQRSGLKTRHIAVSGHEMLIMCPSSSGSASFSRQEREKRENIACTRKGVLVTIIMTLFDFYLAYLLIGDKVTKQK